MNWKQVCSGILLGSLASLIGLPSQAQDSTDQLNQAICSEDWDGAIAILDNAMLDYPNSQNTLAEYRDRLQQLSTTGLSEKQKAQYCSLNPDPSDFPLLTADEETSLSAHVSEYYQQLDPDMTYDDIATLIGRPGKLDYLSSSYTWIAENTSTLSATFSNNELEDLTIGESIDCRENDGCDGIIAAPTEFKQLQERLEVGMNAQAALQYIRRELGEPTWPVETLMYDWQFREEGIYCRIFAYFASTTDGQVTTYGKLCVKEDE
ncbi:MAG: hypothetical protein D6680_11350 [Cyanobacteria bacterium J007]|nr:MAG: hypothetical protein D6680_11350 [Cyanobacteria bacterium J007]